MEVLKVSGSVGLSVKNFQMSVYAYFATLNIRDWSMKPIPEYVRPDNAFPPGDWPESGPVHPSPGRAPHRIDAGVAHELFGQGDIRGIG